MFEEDISLKDKNWFKTGGNARYFCRPESDADFASALQFANKQHLPIFFLGDGANILISDDGFDGLVIKPESHSITIQEIDALNVQVTAHAGVLMPALIDFCLNHNIIGLEEFSGIPGTVGGSIFINLHYFEFLISEFIQNATVIHAQTGNIQTVNPAWFAFDYNTSRLQEKEYYLLRVTFSLKRTDNTQTAYAKGRRDEIIRHRASRYPNSNTCGSFFRNFKNDEVTVEHNGKKIPYIAYYLDKIGIKGTLKSGGAAISHRHANMIVTDSSATSTDVINLARTIQKRVFEQFGLTPQPECRLIGFKKYPLIIRPL